jgi:hypothetical protein
MAQSERHLFAIWHDRTVPVKSVADARRKWIDFREATAAGVSEIGDGLLIVDEDGITVARIHYNGTVSGKYYRKTRR